MTEEQETPQVEAVEAPEAPETQEAAPESRDDEQDRVLMELDPDPDEDDLEPLGAGEEPRVGGGDGDPEESVAVDSSAPTSDEIEAAQEVLRRDGWVEEDFEALPDERLIALAEHRKKMQADVDRKLRDDEESQDDEVPSDSEDGQAEPASDLPDVEDSQHLDTLSDYLGLDEQGKDLLREFQSASVAPVRKQLEEQQALLQNVQVALVRQEVERARTELQAEHPQVRDVRSEEFSRVLERMDKLAQEEPDKPTRDLMEEAVLLEFRGEIKETAQAAKRSLNGYRDQGQPSVKPQPTTPQQQYSSPSEKEDAVLRILESDDPDRFQRARAIGRS